MIFLTRLSGEKFILNMDLIEQMEQTPDTVITLTNSKKIVVRESADCIMKQVIKFKKMLYGSQKL